MHKILKQESDSSWKNTFQKYKMTIFDTSFHFRTKRKFIIKRIPFLIQKLIKPIIQLFDRIIAKEKSCDINRTRIVK